MLYGFIDRVSGATPLRGALDQSVARSRAIGDRVAKASLNNGDGFALRSGDGDTENAEINSVDVEQEMMDLADEQLRYITTAKLLERTYQGLRTAIRGNGG